MKQIIRLFLALATLSLVACSTVSIAPIDQNQGPESIDIIAKAGLDLTKSYVVDNGEGGGRFHWSEDSKIKLLEIVDDVPADALVDSKDINIDENGLAAFALTIAANPAGSSYQYAAIYPSAAYVSKDTETANVVLEIPASQTTPDGTTYDPKADLMISKLYEAGANQPSDGDEILLSFKRLVSAVKLSVSNLALDGDCAASLSFQADGKVLAATAKYDMLTAESVSDWGFDAGNSSDCVIVNLGDEPATSNFDVWMTCAPVTLSPGDEYQIAITTDVGDTFTKTGVIGATALELCEGGVKAINVDFAGILKDGEDLPDTAPVMTSIADENSELYPYLYLDHTIVVSGSNLADIQSFIVDGVSVPIVEGSATANEVKFVMPKTITGTAAKNVSLIAVSAADEQTNLGTIEVLPFYCVKGLKIGIGSNSSKTYQDEGRQYSFLMLREGRVISAQEWVENNIDPYANGKAVGGNSVIYQTSKCNPDMEEEYNSVQPYTILNASSKHKLSFQNLAASESPLQTHRYPGNTAVSNTFGTPIVYFSIVKASQAAKPSIIDGSFKNILVINNQKANAATPYCGAEANDSAWNVGSVLMLQHIKYSYAVSPENVDGKPNSPTDCMDMQGYIVITDVTCADVDGLANADRHGFVFFDYYWSNPI